METEVVYNLEDWERDHGKGEKPGALFTLEHKELQLTLFPEEEAGMAQDALRLLQSRITYVEDCLKNIDGIKEEIKSAWAGLDTLGYSEEVVRAAKTLVKHRRGMLTLGGYLNLDHYNSIRAANLAKRLGMLNRTPAEEKPEKSKAEDVPGQATFEDETPLATPSAPWSPEYMMAREGILAALFEGKGKKESIARGIQMSSLQDRLVEELWEQLYRNGQVVKEGKRWRAADLAEAREELVSNEGGQVEHGFDGKLRSVA